MPPVVMTKVMAVATIRMGALCRSRFRRLMFEANAEV